MQPTENQPKPENGQLPADQATTPVAPAQANDLVTPALTTAASVNPEFPPFSWHASEYIFHAKAAGWYLGLWAIVVVVAGGLVFIQQWLSIAVLVMMALAITVYTRKEPRELNYQIDNHGITVDRKVIPYSQFHSYSVTQEMAWHEIDLEPTKRFVPRLTLLCATAEIDQIEQILAGHLPRNDREPDWVERLSRRLRF